MKKMLAVPCEWNSSADVMHWGLTMCHANSPNSSTMFHPSTPLHQEGTMGPLEGSGDQNVPTPLHLHVLPLGHWSPLSSRHVRGTPPPCRDKCFCWDESAQILCFQCSSWNTGDMGWPHHKGKLQGAVMNPEQGISCQAVFWVSDGSMMFEQFHVKSTWNEFPSKTTSAKAEESLTLKLSNAASTELAAKSCLKCPNGKPTAVWVTSSANRNPREDGLIKSSVAMRHKKQDTPQTKSTERTKVQRKTHQPHDARLAQCWCCSLLPAVFWEFCRSWPTNLGPLY